MRARTCNWGACLAADGQPEPAMAELQEALKLAPE